MPIAYIALTVQKTKPELQFVLKMAAIFTDISTQSNMPLSHCSVDNVLTEATPLFHPMLLQ